jgi:hypothetical protein
MCVLYSVGCGCLFSCSGSDGTSWQLVCTVGIEKWRPRPPDAQMGLSIHSFCSAAAPHAVVVVAILIHLVCHRQTVSLSFSAASSCRYCGYFRPKCVFKDVKLDAFELARSDLGLLPPIFLFLLCRKTAAGAGPCSLFLCVWYSNPGRAALLL